MENIYNTFQLSNGTIVGCCFYDTNGTNRFRAVNESYYKKVDGCIIVYDITDENSFNEIENYFIPVIKEKCKAKIPILILGNKTDMEDTRHISPEQGEQLALKYNYIFKEISSINNVNILETFQEIIETITYKVKMEERKENNLNIRINERNSRKKCLAC